ncbi:hypothetical protein HMPREF0454_02861 [Hafnia alvei ATCC 51873]|uniref:Uncharacterized protein n=1 Tax=Hafnia alvei ATCC 51873 TaxID=1002364 RepID=G9Y8H8_HAFAL|nr:hypothetical protein HMPREF0454_02861 [Hafnia alvei ATCC 51873]
MSSLSALVFPHSEFIPNPPMAGFSLCSLSKILNNYLCCLRLLREIPKIPYV